MADNNVKQLKVTLTRGTSGRPRNHQACARGLGLRRTHSSAVVAATPENLGMISTISYMLKIEEVSDAS